MAGLRKICKAFGGMTVTMNGETVEYVWDYEKDEPVEKSKFTHEQWLRSERKKYEALKNKLDQQKAQAEQTKLFE